MADEFNPTVPEPTTYALAAFGAIAMGVVARRRRA
ncbi:MAG: PEP-CTERM sorting domain-containing protein [Planctomycetaceae bacterium]